MDRQPILSCTSGGLTGANAVGAPEDSGRERHMCLAVPGRILETEERDGNRIARVKFGGITRQAFLSFVPEAEVGDYVMVHVGFAISRVDEEEARKTLDVLEEMGLVEDELGGSL